MAELGIYDHQCGPALAFKTVRPLHTATEQKEGDQETVMYCYECSQADTRGEAIGICHHCSVALCQEHASMIADPVTMTALINRTVVLPKKARLLLCSTCLAALQQDRDAS